MVVNKCTPLRGPLATRPKARGGRRGRSARARPYVRVEAPPHYSLPPALRLVVLGGGRSSPRLADERRVTGVNGAHRKAKEVKGQAPWYRMARARQRCAASSHWSHPRNLPCSRCPRSPCRTPTVRRMPVAKHHDERARAAPHICCAKVVACGWEAAQVSPALCPPAARPNSHTVPFTQRAC